MSNKKVLKKIKKRLPLKTRKVVLHFDMADPWNCSHGNFNCEFKNKKQLKKIMDKIYKKITENYNLPEKGYTKIWEKTFYDYKE